MNKFQVITAILAALAIACAAVILYGIAPVHARTVNACTTVKLPDKKGCTRTRKKIHGYTVTIEVCK